MALFQPGESGNPAGRPPGTPNKSTTQFKEALNALLENNSNKLQEWLERIAETDAAKALDQLGKLAEYIHPKLSRATIEGDPDKPLQAKIQVEFVGKA